MPHVAGYQFSESNRDAIVEWWDAHVNTRWVGKGSWDHEVYFDEDVQGWVSKWRGDFSRNLDVNEYVGYDL